MSAQVLVLCLWVINLIFAAYMHGKPKIGNYSFIDSLCSVVITYIILYSGGFFDVMFVHAK